MCALGLPTRAGDLLGAPQAHCALDVDDHGAGVQAILAPHRCQGRADGDDDVSDQAEIERDLVLLHGVHQSADADPAARPARNDPHVVGDALDRGQRRAPRRVNEALHARAHVVPHIDDVEKAGVEAGELHRPTLVKGRKDLEHIGAGGPGHDDVAAVQLGLDDVGC